MDNNIAVSGDSRDTIPVRQHKTQPVNWDRVPAFNCLLHRDALLNYLAPCRTPSPPTCG